MRNGVRSVLGQRLRQREQTRAVERAAPQIDAAVKALLDELEPILRMYGTGIGLGAMSAAEATDRVVIEKVLPAVDANPALDEKFNQIEEAVSDRLADAAARQIDQVQAAAARLSKGPRLSA